MSSIKLGDWNFEPDYGRLINHKKEELFLDHRLRKILIVLLQNKEAIVRREDMIGQIWEEVQVQEENLTKGVSDLRRWLTEHNINHIEIETIRSIGYRLKVKESNGSNSMKTFSRVLLKSAFYLLLIASFLVLLIRAVRYEN